jgi:hypothetical protein
MILPVSLLLLLLLLGSHVTYRSWAKSKTMNVHPWIRRGLFAGIVFGGCFGNLLFPIFGSVPGLFVGGVVGGSGSTVVMGFAKYCQRRHPDDNRLLVRSTKTVSIALIALGVLGGFAFYNANFDTPVSKHVSNGDTVRIFFSNVMWPGLLLVVYIVLAGPPSAYDPLFGETSNLRRHLIQLLISFSALSSIFIGSYWLSNNFPHPD